MGRGGIFSSKKIEKMKESFWNYANDAAQITFLFICEWVHSVVLSLSEIVRDTTQVVSWCFNNNKKVHMLKVHGLNANQGINAITVEIAQELKKWKSQIRSNDKDWN